MVTWYGNSLLLVVCRCTICVMLDHVSCSSQQCDIMYIARWQNFHGPSNDEASGFYGSCIKLGFPVIHDEWVILLNQKISNFSVSRYSIKLRLIFTSGYVDRNCLLYHIQFNVRPNHISTRNVAVFHVPLTMDIFCRASSCCGYILCFGEYMHLPYSSALHHWQRYDRMSVPMAGKWPWMILVKSTAK